MNYFNYSNGDRMPILGLGTWKSAPGEIAKAIKEAIEIGYRHIDCAWVYGNEAEIGDALQEVFASGSIKREDLHLTSKLWNDCHAEEDVRTGIEKSLSNLKLDYLDLYLIHWPVVLKKNVAIAKSGDEFLPLTDIPLQETWRGMEKLLGDGLTKHIGVSNFSQRKLEDLLLNASIQPEMNQIELHPYLQQKELVDYCLSNQIGVTAYAPLGSLDRPARLQEENEPVLLEDPVINTISKELGVSPAQVLISWSIHRGTVVIPKSVNPGRMLENLRAASLSLCDRDIQKIDALDKHRRYISGQHYNLPGSPYTPKKIWDE